MPIEINEIVKYLFNGNWLNEEIYCFNNPRLQNSNIKNAFKNVSVDNAGGLYLIHINCSPNILNAI